MLLEILLNLRNRGERVVVILREGHSRPELGIAHPNEDLRRVSLPALWGMAEHATRMEPPATIDEPLPVRTQTILSHRVPEDVRRAIDAGIPPTPTGSRRHCITLDLRL
jgi:hypothetical protein